MRHDQAERPPSLGMTDIVLFVLRRQRWRCPPAADDAAPLVKLTEWAKAQGISRQRAQQLWRHGRLPGAVLKPGRGSNGLVVKLPANAVRRPSKNTGGRFSIPTGLLITLEDGREPLPVGWYETDEGESD